MHILTNRRYPELKIYCPSTSSYAEFRSGKLLIEDDDPRREDIMRHATRDPDISIVSAEGVTEKESHPFSCDICQIGFDSEIEMQGHIADKHTDKPAFNEAGEAMEAKVARQANSLSTRGKGKSKPAPKGPSDEPTVITGAVTSTRH